MKKRKRAGDLEDKQRWSTGEVSLQSNCNVRSFLNITFFILLVLPLFTTGLLVVRIVIS